MRGVRSSISLSDPQRSAPVVRVTTFPTKTNSIENKNRHVIVSLITTIRLTAAEGIGVAMAAVASRPEEDKIMET